MSHKHLYNPLSSASASHSVKAKVAYPEIVQRVLDVLRANPPRMDSWDDWHADTTAQWLRRNGLDDISVLTLGAVVHTMEHDGHAFRLWNYAGTAQSSAQPYVADEFRSRIFDQANQIMPLSPLPPNAVLSLIYEEASCSPAIKKIIDDYRVEQARQRRANRPQRVILGPPPRKRIIPRQW